MSKPIKLTGTQVDAILDNLRSRLSSNLFDGNLDIKYRLEDTKERASIIFEPTAFAKMMLLVQGFDSEVAWNGIVRRTDEREFIIEDILVYPQEVSGSTVNTDQGEYEQWLYDRDDEEFNAIRFQGHSHVNMGVTPSGVDNNNQEQMIQQLGDGDFFIFMIWNKKLDCYVKLYDTVTNTLYFRDDVDIYVGGVLYDGDFLTEAHEMVRKKTYKAPTKSTKKKDTEPDIEYPTSYFDNWYNTRYSQGVWGEEF